MLKRYLKRETSEPSLLITGDLKSELPTENERFFRRNVGENSRVTGEQVFSKLGRKNYYTMRENSSKNFVAKHKISHDEEI